MTYNGELQLENAQVTHLASPLVGQSYLLLALDWLAKVKPSADYVVTLRLVDASGGLGGPRVQADSNADWPVVADYRLEPRRPQAKLHDADDPARFAAWRLPNRAGRV